MKIVVFDCFNWFNYFVFDVIGDFVFGVFFGMFSFGVDMVEVCFFLDSFLIYVFVIEIFNCWGEVFVVLGIFLFLKFYVKYFFDLFFIQGFVVVESLVGIVIVCVKMRFENLFFEGCKDFFQRFVDVRDEKGELFGREEFIVEVLIQFIVGLDIIFNFFCVFLYYVVCILGVIFKF